MSRRWSVRANKPGRSAKSNPPSKRLRIALTESLEPRLLFTHSFVVNNAGDGSAPLAALGIPTTDGTANGPVTLRSAIQTADAVNDYTDITFSLAPGTVIAPLSPLPTANVGLSIDGTNHATGNPGIVLNGRFAGALRDGLYLAAGHNRVAGLIIQQFSANGIEFFSFGTGPGGDGNTVTDCWIGTSATSTQAMGNAGSGILLRNSSSNVISNCVISGNGIDGVSIEQFQSGKVCSNNVLYGNKIGTDFSGTRNVGNGLNGISLGLECPANTIGQLTDGNVISGNRATGILISDATDSGNTLIGNKIGTNAAGTAAIPNGENGIVANGPHTIIGGATAGARNVISGNGTGGGLLNTHGIGLLGGGSDTVEGNYIGLNAAGTAAIGNPGDGILVQSPNNVIGGTSVGDGNVISGNGRGIEVQGTGGNKIQGNLIGTDAKGQVALGNIDAGIFLNGAPNNLIGGLPGLPNHSNPQAGNVISNTLGSPANTGAGLLIDSTGNNVEGNFIGTDITGARRMGNEIGIVLEVGGNFIGGGGAGGTVGANLISANTEVGILISPTTAGAAADHNTIQGGNLIGTALDGVTPMGNVTAGIEISGSNNNIIGGLNAGQGNIIADNGKTGSATGAPGVWILGGSGNQVIRNSIFGNTYNGIFLQNGGNAMQAAPTIVNVGNTNNNPRVTGTLTSGKLRSYRIDFYSNPTPAQQGRTWLGFTTITTDGLGKASFQYVLNNVPFAGNQNIVTTATDVTKNNTSPFSSPPTTPPTDLISGTVYRDTNKNNKFDSGEPGLAGFTVYLDKNNNGKLDAGEASVVSASNGSFSFTVPPGTYVIRIVPRTGFTSIYPPAGVGYNVTLSANQQLTGANFGFA